MASPFPTGGIATVRVPRRATAAIHTLLKKKSSYNRNISIKKCSTRWGGWRGVGRCGTSEWSEENAMVEEEVFQFMDLSDKPNHFPTKQELLNAGRSDLVFKILAQGGWLAAGWDYHDAETLHTSSDYGSADDQDDCNGDVLPVLDSPSIIDVSAEDVSNKPEKIASEESGIAAILNGLERERTHFYSEASEAKRGNRHQQFSEDKEYGNALQARQPLNDDKSALEELEKASDALELRETEIMKMRTKLRTTRAKLAALEGTMAMEIMEVRKSIEEKQKKVDAAQKVLSLLRTAHIVWPNSASEVFLAGSFDGWTSQRRMGKSNAGVFVLSMHLYPGRYEIKFIVDGIWRVDPQRPVVYNNGFENNLLVIY